MIPRFTGITTIMDREPMHRLDHFTHVIAIPDETGTRIRSHQLAGGGARFLAGMVDFLIQTVSFIVLAWLAMQSRPDLFPRESWAWAVPVGFIEWHIIYMLLFESFTRGQTPGKTLLSIRIVTPEGKIPGSLAMIVRNFGRLGDLAFACYLGALGLICSTRLRQRLGDLLARTVVIYRQPLAIQMQKARVPQSLYSTSEDGYLLQAWMEREPAMDNDSRQASAVDLAAYLHNKYDGSEVTEQDAIGYLRDLYKAESQHTTPEADGENKRNPEGQTAQ